MANEANQNGDNVEQSGMPTRVLRIDGERTGRLFTNAIRVGRIDKRLRELSLSTNADSRRQFRLGDEGFSKAIGDFENALDQIEKDLAFTTRSKNQEGQSSQAAKRPAPKSKTAAQRVVAGVVQAKPASVTANTGAAPTKQQPPAKKAQPPKQQPQATAPAQPQTQAPAPAPAPAPAAAPGAARKRKSRKKKPKATSAQTQAPASAAQNVNGAQHPKPNDAQQAKPAAENKPAATPALS
jgi:hypothetical protein